MVRTADGRLFAAKADGEVLDLASTAAREWLADLLWSTDGRAASGEALNSAVTTLRGAARHGRMVEVYTRVAPDGAGGIFVDLGRPDDRAAVHVTPTGWDVVERSPVLFYRPPDIKALPIPQRGGCLEELLALTNIPRAAFPLVVGWLLHALRPRGPFAILLLRGPQGAAKSFAALLLKNLLDPDAAELRSPPRDPADLAVAAANSRVLAFDNLSSIPSWFSDALCRASTGGRYATRRLFTNTDESLVDLERPVILTSVTSIIERPDLLDRTVTIALPSITPDRRVDPEELQRRIAEALPRIFGALLDRLAGGLRWLPNVNPGNLPRMAPLVRLAVAAEMAAGEPPRFLKAFEAMAEETSREAIEGEAIGPTLLEFIRRRGIWEGTATALLEELARVNPAGPRDKEWPRGPKALGWALDRLANDLGKAGIRLEKRRASGGVRTIRLSAESPDPDPDPDPDPEKDGHGDKGDVCDVFRGGFSARMAEKERGGGGLKGGKELDRGEKTSQTSLTSPAPPPACPSCGVLLEAPGAPCPDCPDPGVEAEGAGERVADAGAPATTCPDCGRDIYAIGLLNGCQCWDPPLTEDEGPPPRIRDLGDGWVEVRL
jgi:hypothetical protein